MQRRQLPESFSKQPNPGTRNLLRRVSKPTGLDLPSLRKPLLLLSSKNLECLLLRCHHPAYDNVQLSQHKTSHYMSHYMSHDSFFNSNDHSSNNRLRSATIQLVRLRGDIDNMLLRKLGA